jgi:HEAT repeat protein
MTEEEAQSAVATIRAWNRGEGERLSVLLAQLAWRWVPNPTVNAALSETVRHECEAPQDPGHCFQALQALFATGGQSPDLAPVLVQLSERDPEVRANWKSTGLLLERGEIAHRYRSMLLDMLGLLGPAAAHVAEPELIARLSDVEERSRWAAAGALDRVGSQAARQHAAAFFTRNVPPLIDSYRVDRSRRLRACLFLLRAELKGPAVKGLALDALDDQDVGVRSCGAFLLLTSGVPRQDAEDRLVLALETTRNGYARDSIAVALEILDTPRAQQTVRTYTAWEPERVQRIRERWNDRFFRLFGELL